MEAKVETDTGPKEEEQLGKFFEKLADLVPKLKCACEQSGSVCFVKHNNEVNNYSDTFRNMRSEFDLPNTCDYHFSRTINTEYSNKMNISTTTNLIFIESNNDCCPNIEQRPTIAAHNNISSTNLLNNQLSCLKSNQAVTKMTRSSLAVKPCKVRNRPAPYKLTKHDNRYTQQASQAKDPKPPNSRFYHHHHVTGGKSYNSTTTSEPETEERLELLTDVIEYIHNLKSILEDAQNRSYGAELELGSARFRVEDRDPLRRSAYLEASTRHHAAEDSSIHREAPDGLPAIDRTITLLDCTGPSAGGSTACRIVDALPMDRAMELLEYKTGAITLTA